MENDYSLYLGYSQYVNGIKNGVKNGVKHNAEIIEISPTQIPNCYKNQRLSNSYYGLLLFYVHDRVM